MNGSIQPTNTQAIESNVAELLGAASRSSNFKLEPLQGGRNNRTYRVHAGADELLLKWYFTHQDDNRDRLGTEFDFCSCLWRHGIRQIAQPLAADRTVGLGLYDFLPGRRLASRDVTLQHHAEALDFLRQINALRHEPDALTLPNASESCFSLASHVGRIGQRLERLAEIRADDQCVQESVEFIQQQLRPTFEQQRSELEQWAKRGDLDWRADLTNENRCLSPSDFGFHNALLPDDDALRFVDFEYAGWDDPAKLVCDFFCQIEVPALARGFDEFLHEVAQLVTGHEAVVQRARRLLPLYQIKWCCIVLNDFLPTAGARRVFSEPHQVESRRGEQLAVARRLFGRVGDYL